MAHWDEERDKRWVALMRATDHPPELDPLIDLFERTGDIIYWSRFIFQLRRYWFPR